MQKNELIVERKRQKLSLVAGAIMLMAFGVAIEPLRIKVGISVTFGRIALILAYVGFLLESLLSGKVRFKRTIIDYPIIFLFFVMLVSLFKAQNANIAFRLVSIYLIGFAILYIVMNGLESESSIKKALYVWLISGVIISAYGAAQFLAWYYYGIKLELPLFLQHLVYLALPAPTLTGKFVRINSIFLDPNSLAGYLLSFLPILLSLLIYYVTHSFRISIRLGGLFISFILVLIVCILTFSRSGWIALAASLLIIFLYNIRAISLNYRFWLLISITIGFLLYPIFSGTIPWNILLFRLTSSGVHTDTLYHINLMKLALRGFYERPVWGIGIGNFYPFFMKNAPLWMKAGRVHMIVHNIFLSFLCETGLVGEFGLVWLCISIIKKLRRTLTYLEKSSFWYALTVGFLSSFVGIMVGNFFYEYLRFEFVWFSIGLSMAISCFVEKHVKEEKVF